VLRQSIQKAFLTEVKSFLTSQSPSYDINARWPDGYTPLEIACSIAHKNIMETLVNHKAIVDTRNLRDETPLHFLVKAQGVSQKAIEYLLKKRADPNHTNMEGISPLGIASQTGRIETVAILLAFNANPNTVSDTAVSPICMAASGGHLEVVQLLLANNVDPSVPLAAAAERGDLDMVKFLLEKGANPAPVIGFEKNGNDSIFKPVILQLLKKKQREILTLSHSHAPLTHKSTDTLSMSPLPSPAFTASLSASATPPALSHTNLQTTRPSPSKEESLSPAQKNNPTYASVASSPSSLFPDSQLSAGKMQKPLESSTKKAYKR
jgi:Ankyrin repeats (3 copies)